MEQCNNTPNSKAKVPFDPGWNDPPTFSYNAQQTTGTNRPRNFLNKRVAFPLSGGSANSSPQPPINLPPIPVNLPRNVPNIPPAIPSEEPSQSAVDIDSEKTLEDVKRILLQFLEDSAELGPKANDIKRRIAVMEDMWSSGKLNKSIHALMLDLACALRDDQPGKADDLHRALMVDHVSAVGTWMPGVKHLIHHCIARSELMALDKE